MAESFNEIPTPNYNYKTEQLVSAYKSAVKRIKRELERVDLSDFQRAQQRKVLEDIADILSELDATTKAWVASNIPEAVEDGAAGTLYAIGAAETLDEAHRLLEFSRLNRELVKTVVADTQDDLLQVTQNISRKVRTSVRKVAGEVLRENLTEGVNGQRTLRNDMLQRLRSDLGKAVDTGIIDAAGRRWRPEVYVDMAVRTKMMEAHKEATQNEAVARGANYAVISSHGATDKCRLWERRIIKLTRDADGDYPYIGDLPRRQIFHPNCRHHITPVRDPELVP